MTYLHILLTKRLVPQRGPYDMAILTSDAAITKSATPDRKSTMFEVSDDVIVWSGTRKFACRFETVVMFIV